MSTGCKNKKMGNKSGKKYSLQMVVSALFITIPLISAAILNFSGCLLPYKWILSKQGQYDIDAKQY